MNLKELSNLLGLSQTTISRALNGYPEVAEATRLRVLKAAAENGYRPSQSARRLATGRANAVGLVWTTVGSSPDLPVEVDLLRSLTAVSSAHGLHLVLIPATGDCGLNASRQLYLEGVIDAVLLINPAAVLSETKDWPMPVVAFGAKTRGREGFACVDVDYEHCAFDASRLLFQLGHRRLVLVDDNSPRIQQFRDGIEKARKQHAGAFDLSPIVSVENVCALQRHLQGLPGERPTAVFCPELASAYSLIRWTHAQGLMVGKDVSLIAYDNHRSFSTVEASPAVTVCRLDVDLLSRQIFDALQSLLYSTQTPKLQILVKPELVLGATTGEGT